MQVAEAGGVNTAVPAVTAPQPSPDLQLADISTAPVQRTLPQSQQQMQLSFAPLVKAVTPAVVNVYATKTEQGFQSPFQGDPFFSQLFGRDLFHWANRAQAPFRNRHEQWLCTGSYQILADGVTVGWHPDHGTMFGTPAKGQAA